LFFFFYYQLLQSIPSYIFSLTLHGENGCEQLEKRKTFVKFEILYYNIF